MKAIVCTAIFTSAALFPFATNGLSAQPPRAAAAPASSQLDGGGVNVPRTQFIAEMDAEFRGKDLDRNGELSRAEIEQVARNAAYAQAYARNQDLFEQLDIDRTGQLSKTEFAKLVSPPALPDVQREMNWLDASRDQRVSLIEYRAAKLANFDRLDTDHDGVVTPAEMRTVGVVPSGR